MGTSLNSDHCPILLKVDDRDWGPNPFKFTGCDFELGGLFVWCFINCVGSWGYSVVVGDISLSTPILGVPRVLGFQGLLPSFPSQLHSWRTKRTMKNKVYVGSNKFWMPQITVFLSITWTYSLFGVQTDLVVGCGWKTWLDDFSDCSKVELQQWLLSLSIWRSNLSDVVLIEGYV